MNLELVGLLIILGSMGGCGVGLAFTNSGLGLGFLGCVIGLVVFIIGRFQKK